MKKTKIVLVLFLMIALVAITGLSYAYWDSLTAKKGENTLNIGEGVTITISADSKENDGNLVPSDVVLKTGDVVYVDFKYTLVIDSTIKNALKLNVTLSNLKIAGNAANNDLVTIKIGEFDLKGNTYTVNNAFTSSDKEEIIVVRVALVSQEAIGDTQYAAIKNGSITFDISFTAAQ